MGYTKKKEFRLAQGERVTLQSHAFTYLGLKEYRTGQKTTLQARVKVERGGKDLGVYAPALSIFPNAPGGAAIGTPSVRTGVLRDVYPTPIPSPPAHGPVPPGRPPCPLVGA